MRYRAFLGFLFGAYSSALSIMTHSVWMLPMIGMLAAIVCLALDTKDGKVIE